MSTRQERLLRGLCLLIALALFLGGAKVAIGQPDLFVQVLGGLCMVLSVPLFAAVLMPWGRGPEE